MGTAIVTIKMTPAELHTIDEALRLYAYVGHQPPLIVMGEPFKHYTWNMDHEELWDRADQAEALRKDISL